MERDRRGKENGREGQGQSERVNPLYTGVGNRQFESSQNWSPVELIKPGFVFPPTGEKNIVCLMKLAAIWGD